MNTEKFDKFWQMFPHKRGKGDARKAWKQVDAENHFDEIMKSIPLYIADVQSKSWLNWKHPAGWLRAERWYDDYSRERVCDNAGPNAQRIDQMSQIFREQSNASLRLVN